MKARLKTHIAKKVHSSCSKHYSLKWFENQIPRLAAMIVMSQQVKNESKTLDANDCLMKHPVCCNVVGSMFLLAKEMNFWNMKDPICIMTVKIIGGFDPEKSQDGR